MPVLAATPPVFTPDQLKTLRHMLGVNDPYARYPVPTRNHYAATPGDPELYELQRMGAVERTHAQAGCEFFKTTDAGRSAACASFRTIQKSRGARVYRAFLKACDFDADLTFHRFLTHGDYSRMRNSA